MTTQFDGSPKSLLVIGASRGLGLAVVEQYLKRRWHVVGTVRDDRSKLDALREDWKTELEIETVDITKPNQVETLRTRLQGRMLDMLFHIAGIENDAKETIADVSTQDFERVMVTNALSPLRAIESLHGLVRSGGTIAIMSSGQGSVTNNEKGGHEVYRASKAALNSLTRSFAARHADDDRTLLLLAPGWVRTDLGGPQAPLSIDDSIPKLINTIEAQRGKRGLQYLDYRGQTVPW